jgi:uncharacterized protein YcbK (DUF882 family)
MSDSTKDIKPSAPVLAQKNTDSLEFFKLWVDLGKFVLGTVIVGIFTAVINAQIQYKQIALSQQQIEQEHLSQFIEEAMSDRLVDRIRFAKYFASLTSSDAARIRWQQYYQELDEERLSKQRRLDEINFVLPEERARAGSTGNSETLNALLEEKEDLESDVGVIARVFSTEEEFWNDEKLDSQITDEVSLTWRQAIATQGDVRIPRSSDAVTNIEQLAKEIQRIQPRFDRPIEVVTWYRPRPANEAVGSGRNDSHQTGGGVDIRVEGHTSKEVAEKLSDWPGGMGIHNESPDVLHLDNGSRRRFGL